MNTLLIRTEANSIIGLGHLMRTIALAEYWLEHCGQVQFVCTRLDEGLKNLLNGRDISFSCLNEIEGPCEVDKISSLALALKATWIVVDGYDFDVLYQNMLGSIGLKVLWIDECGKLDRYDVDILLNQNLYALSYKDAWYSKITGTTQLCLGGEYALIRNEFHVYRDLKRRIVSRPENILISLGGGAVDGDFLKSLLQNLHTVKNSYFEICVLHAATEQLRDDVSHKPGRENHKVNFVERSDNMAERMAWADMAITAGGSTTWEKLFMGLPSIVFSLYDNQDLIVDWLKDNSMATVLKKSELSQIEKALTECFDLNQMGNDVKSRGPRLVDGRGAERLCKMMCEA